MKYVLALIILVGGLVVLIGIVLLAFYIGDKIKDWEWELDGKCEKYRYIKNEVMPWVAGIFMLCVLVASLVGLYFSILMLI